MSILQPQWHPSPRVRSLVTTRTCGNLARHVGNAGDALANRRRLAESSGWPSEPLWMEQVHGNRVVEVSTPLEQPPRADAAYTRLVDQPLVVMVADCLPILLASRSAEEIAVVHAGWRGLACGVILEAVGRFGEADLVAWLGPAIGPCHYEVDRLVRQEFDDGTGFGVGRDTSHWMMDLYAIARRQLGLVGVTDVHGGGFCTWCDDRFYSHRRDGNQDAGRFAAVIWKSSG